MRNASISRFSMMFGASAAGNSTTFLLATDYTLGASNIAQGTAATAPTGTGAVLKIACVGTTISQIYVKTAATGVGASYKKGNIISIQEGGTATDKIVITLTDVQANMLNGTLDNTSTMTELPFIAGDVFHIKINIQSSSSQTNTSGTSLASSKVDRAIDLQIKLY